MKKSVMTRMLAFFLSVTLLSGNVLPAYAAETEGANTEGEVVEAVIPEESLPDDDVNNEENGLQVDVVQVDTPSNDVLAVEESESDRPSLSYKYDENGLAEGIIIDCSETEYYGMIYIDLYSENGTRDRVQAVQATPEATVEVSFSEFNYAPTNTYDEIIAYFASCELNGELIGPYASLEGYVFNIVSESYDGTPVYYECERTADENSEILYISTEQFPENTRIIDILYTALLSNEPGMGVSGNTSEWSLNEDGTKWFFELENHIETDMRELTYCTMDIEEGQVNVNYYVVSDEQLVTEDGPTVPDDGNDPDIGGDEATLATPSAELMMDDIDDPTIRLTNNASETCNLYYGWMKQGDELSDISLNCGWDIYPGDYTNIGPDHLKDYDFKTPGEYYLVLYAENEEGVRSESYMFMDYPFVVEDNGVMEDTLNLATGNISGRVYVEGFAIPGEVSGYAEVLAAYEDGTTDDATLSLTSYYNVPCFNKEDIDALNELYESWEIQSIYFTVVQMAPAQSVLTKAKAQEFTEGIRYEEATALPTVSLSVLEDGTVNGIQVRNNSYNDSEFCMTLLTEDEIKNIDQSATIYDCFRHEMEGFDTKVFSFNDILNLQEWDEGTNYLVYWMKEDSYAERCDYTVFENYPITVTSVNGTKTATYKTHKDTDYSYIWDIHKSDYVCGLLEIETVLGDNIGNYEHKLAYENNYFQFDCLELGWLVGECDSWSIDTIKLLKVVPEESGATLLIETYESLEDGGITDEFPYSDDTDDTTNPDDDIELEAPSLSLAYDEDDNVTGILLTNNSDIDFCYDILTREEIESNAQLKNSSWFYDTSIEIPFRDIIDYNNYDPGTYYFVAYTERYGTLSERVVLEDYPIVISKETLDETITYHTGDVSGVEFYTDYPTTGFNYMRHIIECGEGEDAWTMTSSVEDDREFFWFNKEEYDDWYFAWSFKGLLYGEINASEEGCTITETTFLNVEKGEDYEEPQAPAPTVSLHTDENGVVDGVNITNNLTHDYGRTWIRLELGEHTYYLEYYSNLDPGETVTYFFKDLDIMFDDFEEFKDITGKLYCYTRDDDTGLKSKNVYLDIPVSVEQTNYEGDTITLRTEFGEEDGEKVCWMYVDADKLPANQNVYYVNYGMTWDDGDSYEASDVLRLTDDGTQRLASCYGNIDSTKISSIKCETVASSESAIKIQYTVVSGDKLVVENADLSRKPVILLDYDYYNAFIASGGTVTVKDGDLVMSTDKFTTSVKWTLDYLQQWFEGTGLYRFVKNITKAVKSDANKYWTCEVGEFQPVNYYNTDGKVIAEESLSKQDIVLIKYEPEIVWVDSMELKAPKIMEFDQTAKVTAILDAGQDKYPFERTPQVRFESSNSDILAVDAATGELTAGTEAGTVTITAYADEDLRIEEGLDEIVTASVTINVEPKHEHNYVFTTEKKATFDEDGKRIGVCACEASTVEEVIYQVAPVELGQTSYTYDGTIKKPAVTVKDTQGTALVEGTDYTVAYKNNKNAGTAAVTVTLKGNYAGTATKNFDIVAKDINACTASFTKKFAYTGKAIAPTVTVKNGSVTLVKGTDYTVAYSANIKPGKAIVTITGKGNYSGLIEKSFVIVPKKATLSSVTASTTVAGRLTVKWTKDSLADGYMLQYSTSSSFTASTTKTLTIDGNATVSKTLSGLTQGKTYYVRVASYVTVDKTAYNGAYSTSLNAKTKKNFTVNTISNKAYTGSAINPTVTVKNGSTTLKKDTDYTVAYKNNKYPGLATVTVKGKGNYAGTVTTTFVIVPKKAAVKTTTSTGVGKLKVTWTKDAYANGYRLQYSTSSTFASGKTQTVIIKGNATLSKVLSNLTEGTTYYVRVASYVTVNGQNYYGTYSVKQSAKVRSSFTVNAIGNKTYTGKALVPVITVKCGSKILKKGTDYNVTYSNNLNPGLAKVKVTGIGNYAGTVNTTFKIVPKKATLSSVSSAAVGKLTAKWVKDAKADGYIVQYSTSSNFAAAATETIEINSYTKLSTTVNNLTSKTKYFVRVAAFTTIDDAVYRGSYSAVKSIIVK